MTTTQPLSPVESTKAASRNLRGPLAEELTDPGSPFSHDAGHLLKFHGIYAQDDRDQRRSRTRAGEPLAYSCMVRCSIPGGRLRPEQWFAIDRLADEVSDGGLRLTTRQGVQYHFVHKGDLRLTANQNLIIANVAPGDRPQIEALLKKHRLDTANDASGLKLNAMSCVALPTCGLALAESATFRTSSKCSRPSSKQRDCATTKWSCGSPAAPTAAGGRSSPKSDSSGNPQASTTSTWVRPSTAPA